MISVGFISNRLNGRRSGVEVYAHNLVEGLDGRADIDLSLINHRRTHPEKKHIVVGAWTERIGLPEDLWNLYLQMYLGSMDVHTDIIHSPENAGYVLTPRKAKKVVTVHDTIAYLFPGHMPRRIRFRYRNLFPLNIRTANRIIADSESTKRYIVDLFSKPEDSIDVVPLAAERHYQPPSQGQLDDFRLRMGMDDPYILFVGNFMEHKNILRLLRAFENLRRDGLKHQLIIAGSAHGCDRDEALGFIKHAGLEGSVRLSGYVPLEDMPLLYGAADLLVCPSLCEGFGLTPLEAMSCGTPVAVSNRTSLPEVVGDAGLYFDPFDVEDITRTMRGALTSSELSRDLSRKGLQKAMEFSWERTVSSTVRTYEKALDGD